MSDKRLNNTIYLMFVITKEYCRVHDISVKEFREIDNKYGILHLVSECPDIFDSMTQTEMIEEIDQFCSGKSG